MSPLNYILIMGIDGKWEILVLGNKSIPKRVLQSKMGNVIPSVISTSPIKRMEWGTLWFKERF